MNTKNKLIFGQASLLLILIITFGLIIINEKAGEIFTPKVKTLACFSLACVLMVGGSFAYFSDYAQTTVEGTSGTVRIGVDNNINL